MNLNITVADPKDLYYDVLFSDSCIIYKEYKDQEKFLLKSKLGTAYTFNKDILDPGLEIDLVQVRNKDFSNFYNYKETFTLQKNLIKRWK